MPKRTIILILLLITVTISFSGCTTKEATNGTFGEKIITINNITIVNNVTTEHYERNGTKFYIITGYLKNNDKYDAFNIKMKSTVYDIDGNVVATNDTVYLDPKVVPAGGESLFGFSFNDSDNRIFRYEIQFISATAEP